MTRISAIVLAAGESRRMGYVNKLELPVQGMPLVWRTVDTLLCSELEEIVVVVGHEAERVRAILDGLDVCIVYNEHYLQGQVSSVRAGLAAMSRPCDGIMICPSDQGLLEPADIHGLIDAFARRSHGSVLVPTHQGRRGNPVICDYRHRQAILAGGRDMGCRQFMEANPDLVFTHEVEADHVLFDVDTPADYEALLVRINRRDGAVDSLGSVSGAAGAVG